MRAQPLEVATLVHGNASVVSDALLTIHRMPAEWELGAFLFAAMLVMARARVIVANAGSNLGNLIMTLAGTRTAFEATPHVIDLDGTVTADALWQGKYLCNLAPNRGTSAKSGMCAARGLSKSEAALAPQAAPTGC